MTDRDDTVTTQYCAGCGEEIGADETIVHGDDGSYHVGCEFETVHCEVGDNE